MSSVDQMLAKMEKLGSWLAPSSSDGSMSASDTLAAQELNGDSDTSSKFDANGSIAGLSVGDLQAIIRDEIALYMTKEEAADKIEDMAENPQDSMGGDDLLCDPELFYSMRGVVAS